jgi:hypothetical protein
MRKRNQEIKSTIKPTINIVEHYQVEQWEEEEGVKPLSSKK